MFFYAPAKDDLRRRYVRRRFISKGISPCAIRPLRKFAAASSKSATGKNIFGESSSVRLRGPDDFPLMPRLPLVEELLKAASRSTNDASHPGETLQGTVLKITALQLTARVTKT
jgi:hypothetical protein